MNRITGAGLALAFGLALGPADAGAQPGAVQTPLPLSSQAPPQPDQRDAATTREQLHALLREHPPAVWAVLQLDPSLLGSETYLAPYPRLAQFVGQHPEIARNPSYFLGSLGAPVLSRSGALFLTNQLNRDRQASDMIPEVLAGAAVFIVAVTFLVIVGSLLRQLVEHRRWLRQSRLQTEVHTKILDRLQSNEDLLSYLQTPAGRQFLASAPIAATGEVQPVAAPFARILWSVQAGVVLAFLGLGLWYVQPSVVQDIAPAFYVMGVVAVAVGLGAIASGAIAYLLSARFGLIPPPKHSS